MEKETYFRRKFRLQFVSRSFYLPEQHCKHVDSPLLQPRVCVFVCILAQAYESWHDHAHQQARARGALARITRRWLCREVFGSGMLV